MCTCKHEYNNTWVPRMLVVSQEQTVSASNLRHYTCRHNSRVSTSLRNYMLWSHVNSNSHNASPHTSLYSCLDKLRVLPFMSAEHDVRAKTLLPKGANRTNSKPSSQDRCQSHWCCRAVFKSVLLRLLWQKYCAHPFLIYYTHMRARAYKHLRWVWLWG